MPALAALAALVITATAAYYAASAARAQERLEFARAVKGAQSDIQARLAAYVAMLRAGAGLFAAAPYIGAEEFRAYVERLDLAQQYPGIQGIGFSMRIAPGEREDVIAAMRQRGQPQFTIWPAHPRDEYHAILYLEPLDRRNRAAIGYDMFSEPVRRTAMERARDTGLPAASGIVTLVQEIDERKQPGFLIYVPVYRHDVAGASVEERREALLGFVYSPFRAYDLLPGILGPGLGPFAGVTVADGPADRATEPFYRAPAERDGRAASLAVRTQIDVAGRPWTLSFHGAGGGSGRGLAAAILLVGATMSGLLYLATRYQVQGRLAAERLADARLEGEQRFRQLALDNARLFHETEARRQEVEALFDLGRLLAETLEPEVVGARVVENVRGLLHSEMAVLYRVEPLSGDLHLLAGVGPQVDWNRVLRRGTAVVGVAIAQRQPVVTADLLHDPRVSLTPEARARIVRSGYRAVLAVPLILGDRVVAALAVGDRAGRTFTDDETRLLQTFAQTAVLALENARLYAEERAAREEAERASRAKDEFLAILSHELRTPLTAMFGWIRLLRTGQVEPARQAQGLAVIERNTRLQARLIDDLLDVSRIVWGKLRIEARPTDLTAIVEDAVEAMRRDAETKAQRIEADLAAPACVVAGDAARLNQVVVNLLANAVKFTPERGVIRVRLSQDAGQARLTVSDSGHGIEPELLAHVFDPFRQAALPGRGQGGLGLGLAIVHALVDLHGGRVTAESPGIDGGATFTVTLPLLAGAGIDRDAGRAATGGER
ncbi:MAG TPA: CHASE domain-containing protein, partial [Candidatus Tectomicrobia bacterium]|nr:CHASE domain-containing protein [Candidatus Tectomicrobia bacterium]